MYVWGKFMSMCLRGERERKRFDLSIEDNLDKCSCSKALSLDNTPQENGVFQKK